LSRVVDYAWGRPSIAALKGAGAVAVCRYLSRDTSGKTLSRAEADGLRTGGIDIVSNWEQAGSWAEYSGGQSTGRTHAVEAARQHIACGGPPDRPIYFSTDWDATGTQLPTVAEYYRGVASVIGPARTGAYGGYRTIKYLFDQGVIRWGWQTYAWSTFRDEPTGQMYLHWDSRAQLRQVRNGVQVGGVDCDLDDSMTDDFGQWAAKGSTVTELDRTSTMADHWGSAIAQQQDTVVVVLGNGSTATVPNLLKERLTTQATLLGGVAADVAGLRVALGVAQSAITALAGVVAAGGGNIDTAAILARIDAAQASTSEAVAALQAQNADLMTKLARAAQATADELG
jgi:hypothetical protein